MSRRRYPIVATVCIGYCISNYFGGATSAEHDSYLLYLILISGGFMGLLWGYALTIFSENFLSDYKIQLLLLYTNVFMSTILFGGSLMSYLSFQSLNPQNNSDTLRLIVPPYGENILFSLLLNTQMDLLLQPLLLFSFTDNPSYAVQVSMFASSLLYYSSRISTYLYFSPTVINRFVPLYLQLLESRTMGSTSDQKLSHFNLSTISQNEISFWVNMRGYRCITDGMAAILLFFMLHFHFSRYYYESFCYDAIKSKNRIDGNRHGQAVNKLKLT